MPIRKSRAPCQNLLSSHKIDYLCLMPRLPIDTLHLVKRLQEAGFSPAQAEAQVEVLLELYALQETATKSDLKKLRIRSKKDIAQTEARLWAEIQETEARLRAEIQKTEARLRAEIQETEARLRAEIQEVSTRLRADIEKLRAEVENNRLEVEKLKIALQETEKRLLLHLQETEARLRADIWRMQVRIILWIAGLIAAQIPIFYLLRHFLGL
jgi:chromosome segregation ATPase